jgi:hypothetical protein
MPRRPGLSIDASFSSIPVPCSSRSGSISGAVVFAVLAEDAQLTERPGFPWEAPRSFDRRVLSPVRLCKRTRASSRPIATAGFRAIGHGTATSAAPLTPGRRSAPHPPAPYRAFIRVLG